LTEGGGIPLAMLVTGAQRQEMKKLAALLDARVVALPAPEEGEGRHLCLDRGYDSAECRTVAVAHGYQPHIPPKASAAQPLPPPGDPTRHPPRRWVVEVSHAWFNRFRRVLIRWEKKAANYLGFVQLAACLIVYRKLRLARTLSG
jgi:transposase